MASTINYLPLDLELIQVLPWTEYEASPGDEGTENCTGKSVVQLILDGLVVPRLNCGQGGLEHKMSTTAFG
jgi:hypothetical protein